MLVVFHAGQYDSNEKFAQAVYTVTTRMGKRTILIFAAVLALIGAYIPVLFGIDNGAGGWSVLGGLVGGLSGIWLATWISRRF